MLKADTRLWQETLTTIAVPVLFFGLGTLLFKGVPVFQVITGAGLVAFLRGVMLAVHGFKGLWRVEQRRQAAAKRREWVPLAHPQPTSDPTALPLPAVICARPSWLSYPFGFIVVWAAILLSLLFWFGPYVVNAFVRALVISCVMTLLVSLPPYLDSYRWIEVRDEGLTIRTLFRRQSIRWEEARLFAIDATVKTTALPDHYELSSATTILRWSRELKDSRFTHFSPLLRATLNRWMACSRLLGLEPACRSTICAIGS